MKYLQSLMIIALLSLSLFSLPIIANYDSNNSKEMSLQQRRRQQQRLHISHSDHKQVHVHIKRRGGSKGGGSSAVALKSSVFQVYSLLGFSVFFALFFL
ncbi:hypothetical protein ABFS82_11G031800 [Erythranthe guttata]